MSEIIEQLITTLLSHLRYRPFDILVVILSIVVLFQARNDKDSAAIYLYITVLYIFIYLLVGYFYISNWYIVTAQNLSKAIPFSH